MNSKVAYGEKVTSLADAAFSFSLLKLFQNWLPKLFDDDIVVVLVLGCWLWFM